MRVDANGHHLDVAGMRKMCSDKYSYATKAVAKRYLNIANSQRRKKGQTPLHIYKCPICEHYHFTSQPRKEDRKQKKGGGRRGRRGERD